MAECLIIADIHPLSRSEATDILTRIARVEKRTFPSNEAFDFSIDLWRKKPNTRVIYVMNPPLTLVAYAVYVRQKGIALLHKVCVAEQYRQQGMGTQLLKYIQERLSREGCQCIQLWVDEAREPARRLYSRCGFHEREALANYYAPGRSGIRMVFDL
jgi:ribosomal protein S18 acetylase RimI-like enzyme